MNEVGKDVGFEKPRRLMYANLSSDGGESPSAA
jgi:hypothetical protein